MKTLLLFLTISLVFLTLTMGCIYPMYEHDYGRRPQRMHEHEYWNHHRH